jgi:nucleotide-binding universal stress UspA family protein
VIVVWIVEGTWEACIDATRDLLPAGAPVMLLHVTPAEIGGVAGSAFAGLLGRGHRQRDPARSVTASAIAAAEELLAAAGQRLGSPADQLARTGRVEREVVAACGGATALVVARDGELSRIGPASLGPATRFVVDHAPCPVLLVWPGTAPEITTMPPPPSGHRPEPPR